MPGSKSRQSNEVDGDRILAELSTRQYLAPHRSLGEVLADAQRTLRFCPQAAAAGLRWLNLDSSMAVGRLRRTELIQLARSIHRFWRQALAGSAPQSQPA
jgi:hypothetical protein